MICLHAMNFTPRVQNINEQSNLNVTSFLPMYDNTWFMSEWIKYPFQMRPNGPLRSGDRVKSETMHIFRPKDNIIAF